MGWVADALRKEYALGKQTILPGSQLMQSSSVASLLPQISLLIGEVMKSRAEVEEGP